MVHLDEEDVVRHRLVKEIIKRYNESDEVLKIEAEKKKAEKKAYYEQRNEQRNNDYNNKQES
jgi:hypothetical protein